MQGTVSSLPGSFQTPELCIVHGLPDCGSGFPTDAISKRFPFSSFDGFECINRLKLEDCVLKTFSLDLLSGFAELLSSCFEFSAL